MDDNRACERETEDKFGPSSINIKIESTSKLAVVNPQSIFVKSEKLVEAVHNYGQIIGNFIFLTKWSVRDRRRRATATRQAVCCTT